VVLESRARVSGVPITSEREQGARELAQEWVRRAITRPAQSIDSVGRHYSQADGREIYASLVAGGTSHKWAGHRQAPWFFYRAFPGKVPSHS